MNKISFLIILLCLISCYKKETASKKENRREFSVIDSKFPLYIDKIDFESKNNFIQLNDEINSKISEIVTNYYNVESSVEDEEYKKDFGIEDCYFSTIRLKDKYHSVFVIILKSFPTKELVSKILFYDNNSKEFIGKPMDFKIYALYDFSNGKIIPTNLKEKFKIRTPEIKTIDIDKDGKNEFECTRLWHNGTFNAIEISILQVTDSKIDTIHNSKKEL